MKTCKTCNIGKPLTEFYKSSGMKDGLTSKCKECRKKSVGTKPNKEAAFYNSNDIVNISKRYNCGESLTSIARDYGVSRQHISQLIHTYKNRVEYIKKAQKGEIKPKKKKLVTSYQNTSFVIDSMKSAGQFVHFMIHHREVPKISEWYYLTKEQFKDYIANCEKHTKLVTL